MNFVTIDFETADVYRNSPCEVGLTFVEDNEIVDTKSWLIKPQCWPKFNAFCYNVHGIKPDDVKTAPTFDELWPELKEHLNNQNVIAHNASFDFSVLKETLDTYGLEYPDLQYACSYIFSKQAFPDEFSYGLSFLCAINGIKFDHHRAASDSYATAALSLKIFSDYGIMNFDQLSETLKTRIGKMTAGQYTSCITKRDYSNRTKLDMSQFKPDSSKENPDSVFYQKKIVFTGTLNGMVRKDAFQAIVDIGGIVSDKLTTDVDFLIVGQHNYAVVDKMTGLSGKQKKAVAYSEKGYPIEIVPEDFFYRNL